MPADIKSLKPEEIEKAMKVYESYKKQQQKRKQLSKDPEYRAKMRAAHHRRLIRQKLLAEKALKAGITVSDAEVEAYLKKK